MRCKQTMVVGSLVTLSMAVVSCSQISNAARERTKPVSSMVIKAEAFDTNACNRGMFVLSAFKDFTKGEVATDGRGFLTKDVVKKPDPYFQIKLGLKPKDPKSKTPPASSKKMGLDLQVTLGENAVPTDVSSTTELATSLRAMKTEAGIDPAAADEKKLVLTWDPKSKAYYSQPGVSPKIPLDSPLANQTALARDNQEGAPLPGSRGGVGQVHSFVFGLKGPTTPMAISANLPDDISTPQIEGGDLTGEIDDSKVIEISIEDSAIPRDSQGLITVLVEARDKSWRTFWHQRDDGGTTTSIAIPTKGKDADGKSFEMKKGNVRVVVTRQTMTAHEMQDGGNLCIVTTAGAATLGSLSEPKEGE